MEGMTIKFGFAVFVLLWQYYCDNEDYHIEDSSYWLSSTLSAYQKANTNSMDKHKDGDYIQKGK